MVVLMTGSPAPPRTSQDAACRRLPSFAVVSIDGKGMGIVARRPISMGERILADVPLLVLHGDWKDCNGQSPLMQAWRNLSADGRATFFALSQNAMRFGDQKTVDGIFATNAIPFHRSRQPHCAIFPLASRFNHACDSNAAYRWNERVSGGALTIHATRQIHPGEEICVNYGFPTGCTSRDKRQARLIKSFGFVCTCSHCSLVGNALRQSDARRAAIGDEISFRRELDELARVDSLVTREPAAILAQLDDKLQLMREECPDGLFPGIECFLQGIVQFCDSAASQLAGIAASCPPNAPGGEVTLTSKARDVTLTVPLDALRAKARAFTQAAMRWAMLAKDVTRAVQGADSCAYEVWSAALDPFVGCWHGANAGAEQLQLDQHGDRRRSFVQLWMDAGLCAPLSTGELSTICQPRIHN